MGKLQTGGHAHNQPVPLELLDVEDGVAGGQIQSVAADHVRQALHRCRQVQPTKPIDVILLNAPLTEPRLPPKLYRAPSSLFLSSLRRQERGSEWPACGGCPEAHMAPNIPVNALHLVAGDDQYGQG